MFGFQNIAENMADDCVAYPIVGNLFDIDLEHGLQSVLALGREYGTELPEACVLIM